MPVWWKAFLAVLVVLVPGGFVMLLAYTALRVLWLGWTQAAERAAGGQVHVRDVLASVRLEDIVREARAAF